MRKHTSTSLKCPAYIRRQEVLSVDHSLAVLSRLPVAKYTPIGLHFTSHTGFSWPRYATTLVRVSIDHNRTVASADADSKNLGGAADPQIGSNATEYTGPLCPISFLVVLPFFSRIFSSPATERRFSGLEMSNNQHQRLTVFDCTGLEITSKTFQLFAFQTPYSDVAFREASGHERCILRECQAWGSSNLIRK